MRRASVLTMIATAAFVAAFLIVKRAPASLPTSGERALAPDAPDSLRLRALGYKPGPQLVAYVFGGSQCSYCNSPETKAVVAALRDGLMRRYAPDVKAVSVIGVAINTDIELGLRYLRSLGIEHFDEITTGKGWQNEQVIHWIRRQKVAEAAVPLIVVVARGMQARLNPITVTFTPDSVVAVVQGRDALVEWSRNGFPLTEATVATTER